MKTHIIINSSKSSFLCLCHKKRSYQGFPAVVRVEIAHQKEAGMDWAVGAGFWCLCAVCLSVQASLDRRFLIEATWESSQNHQGTFQESIHVSKSHLPIIRKPASPYPLKLSASSKLLTISTCAMIGSQFMWHGHPILTLGVPCICVWTSIHKVSDQRLL